MLTVKLTHIFTFWLGQGFSDGEEQQCIYLYLTKTSSEQHRLTHVADFAWILTVFLHMLYINCNVH